VSYKIESIQRQDILEIPEIALREAVINAVTHRNYFEDGANVMIEIFDDRVEISNPGGLPKGLEPKDFGKKSVRRNPLIANLFQRARFIEKLGTGINRMKQEVLKAGLQEPQYEFTRFFTILFKRLNTERVGERVGEKVGEKMSLTENQKKIIDLIGGDKTISAKKIAEIIGISVRKTEENLAKLRDKGIIKRVGPAKGGYWEINP
jgi:ATP-dependent DNA helicase RecG